MSSTQTDKTVLHLFASHTQGLIWRRGLPGFNPDWKIPDRGYKFLPKVQLGSSFFELIILSQNLTPASEISQMELCAILPFKDQIHNYTQKK